MLKTKSNLKTRKITEALQETVTVTDPMLVSEILTDIRDTADNLIQQDFQNIDTETISVCYELAEMTSYTIDKIFNKLVGI